MGSASRDGQHAVTHRILQVSLIGRRSSESYAMCAVALQAQVRLGVLRLSKAFRNTQSMLSRAGTCRCVTECPVVVRLTTTGH